MNNAVTKTIDYSLIGISALVGASDITNILNIVILVIDALWILAKFVMAIYNAVKNKDSSQILSSIKELKSDVENLKDELEPTNTTENKKEG